MGFFDLSEDGQKCAGLMQCWDLRDQPENIVSFEEYGALADFHGFRFDASGEVTA